MKPEPILHLTPGKRVLFLTKDPDLIRRQLRGELDLQMKDLSIDDLLDDINTDAMTPAWVCFDYKPEDIARNAYAGLIVGGERLFPPDALRNGNFEVIVSGLRKGVGSSRETATQCEVFSGLRIAVAASFAPIHAGNNINQGLLMANHDMLVRLQAGEGIAIDELTRGYDAITQLIIREGGLFPFAKAVERGEIEVPVPHTAPRPMTMGEKILARHVIGGSGYVKPGDAIVARVDGGYTHEFTTAQVHHFLNEEYGPDYAIRNPQKFAVFEDHLIYADEVTKMRPFLPKIEILRDMQRAFQQHTSCRDFSANGRVSPGICHEVAREYIVDPGDHRLPYLYGRREQRPGLGGRHDRVREPRPRRLHEHQGVGVDPLRAHRPTERERHGQGCDALYPPEPRPAAAHVGPHHGIHRPRSAGAVARRAGHAGEHGH